MLKGAPCAEEVSADLRLVCKGREIVAFNVLFDLEACMRTFKTEDDQLFDSQGWLCAMKSIAVPIIGATNRHGTISLSDATYSAGVQWEGRAHSAKADALATVDLIRVLAKTSSQES